MNDFDRDGEKSDIDGGSASRKKEKVLIFVVMTMKLAATAISLNVS